MSKSHSPVLFLLLAACVENQIVRPADGTGTDTALTEDTATEGGCSISAPGSVDWGCVRGGAMSLLDTPVPSGEMARLAFAVPVTP